RFARSGGLHVGGGHSRRHRAPFADALEWIVAVFAQLLHHQASAFARRSPERFVGALQAIGRLGAPLVDELLRPMIVTTDRFREIGTDSMNSNVAHHDS